MAKPVQVSMLPRLSRVVRGLFNNHRLILGKDRLQDIARTHADEIALWDKEFNERAPWTPERMASYMLARQSTAYQSRSRTPLASDVTIAAEKSNLRPAFMAIAALFVFICVASSPVVRFTTPASTHTPEPAKPSFRVISPRGLSTTNVLVESAELTKDILTVKFHAIKDSYKYKLHWCWITSDDYHVKEGMITAYTSGDGPWSLASGEKGIITENIGKESRASVLEVWIVASND